NLGLKILSLLCALVLYAFLHGTEATRPFSVNIIAEKPRESTNRMLLTQLPTEAIVTLRGPLTLLSRLPANACGHLPLDLHTERMTSITLDASMFHIPPGFSVEQIIPSSIELRWDDVISRSIQVQVARTGEPAPAFTVKGAIGVEPPNVQARGPRSIVEVMQ